MKKFSIIISTIILILLFIRLADSYSDRFDKVDKAYNSKSSVNLSTKTDPKDISQALVLLESLDEKDANFIALQLSEKLKEGVHIEALSDLNRRIWQVPVAGSDSIESPHFKTLVEKSNLNLGQDSVFMSVKDSEYPSSVIIESGAPGTITVNVVKKDESAGTLAQMMHSDKIPRQGVLVRLQEHVADSIGTSEERTIAWAKTDSQGNVTFAGLNPESSYSVLPIGQGMEYGTAKGTTLGSLRESGHNNAASYSFIEDTQKVRLFTPAELSEIKEKHILTLRTPKEYKDTVSYHLALVLCAWWLLYFINVRRRKNYDSSLIAALMLLTGICLLIMFSINDPLEDRLVGAEMANGVLYGVVIMMAIQFVDFTKLYRNKYKIGFDIPFEILEWIFKPFRNKVSYLTDILRDNKRKGFVKLLATCLIMVCLPFIVLDLLQITRLSSTVNRIVARLPKGSGYLITALLLTAALWTPFGSEVGGMKVNLNIFGLKFQPSEITKYLIIFFMAAFFTSNATNIMKYSESGNIGLFSKKVKMLSVMVVGLLILMVMYLVLGDMGPGLVLTLTFIVLYSVIKSRTDLNGLNEKQRIKKILTSDLAMLIYGLVSFLILLAIGYKLGMMLLFCIAWFGGWIAFGLIKKEIFESAILFNIIIAAFIFGGSLMKATHVEKLETVGERLESRNKMCTNTWGTLPIDNNIAEAGENTQVAEGLWGLASGGLAGQGLGNGSPTFIPAFHTDMILESIGEQTGFIGILVIVFLLAMVLRKTILIGYRTRHTFAFYFCLGIAIVTAVQFIIISLGSTGIIPLTGVTVPFLSFGKVSMIINLIAFGIVLTFIQPAKETQSAKSSAFRKDLQQYNYSVSVLSWMFCAVAAVILLVFFHYQIISRYYTLVRPLYVTNSSGMPVIQYNPRIAKITDKMWAGDIYDRNGILLATSDKSKLAHWFEQYKEVGLDPDTAHIQKRYYPFGNHLAFMLGKFGSDIYTFTSENTGYTAEYRHLSELRGFDNKKYDANHNPIKVALTSDKYKPKRFIGQQSTTTDSIILRDYTALVPYLIAGGNSDRIDRMNARKENFMDLGRIEPKDIYITVDALLQTELQQRLEEHVKSKFPNLGKVRASVVILDAQNGDLLTSAVYPLPDENRIKEADGAIYNDMIQPASWKAYTDVDLGLIYPTPPGSTAKVLTGLAGFRKYKDEIARTTYDVAPEERIFPREPALKDMTMKDAYRHSSNCYFINLLNDKDLFSDISQVYGTVGVNIEGKKSYGLRYTTPDSKWLNMVTGKSFKSIELYRKYKSSGKKEKMNKHNSWSWSWGQNGIEATPLAMARTISIVANNGFMPKTRFLLTDSIASIKVVENTELLKDFLKFTAVEHDKFLNMPWLGGKTGTPERYTKQTTVKKKLKDGSVITQQKYSDRKNDGWYICFIEGAKVKSKDKTVTTPLAIAIRLERINDGMSGKAVEIMKSEVLETLNKLGYLEK